VSESDSSATDTYNKLRHYGTSGIGVTSDAFATPTEIYFLVIEKVRTKQASVAT